MKKTALKERLDVLMVDRGLSENRTQALGNILAGKVRVNGVLATKGGERVSSESEITVVPGPTFVSRGGNKLIHAIREFRLNVHGRAVLDIGAGEGGFTDVLLKEGAKKVFAVDVGYGKLHERLRKDPRVRILERCNVRYLTSEKLYENEPEKADMAVIDLAFISVKKVLPVIWELLESPREIVILVKPQFEAKREEVKRGGIMRDPVVQVRVLLDVTAALESIGWNVRSACSSPILGRAGNMEFLLHATAEKSRGAGPEGIQNLFRKMVQEAHAKWD